MSEMSQQRDQEMQPFIDALRQFFNVMGATNLADGEFHQIVSTYLARLAAGVLETMAQFTPNPAEVGATLPSEFFDATSATAAFAGAYSGSASIHCPTSLAEILAARMTGLECEGEHEIVHDALAEMASVIAGEIKQTLSVSGLDIQLSTPGVVSGSHYLRSSADHHRVTVCFTVEGAPMYVSMVAERNRFLQAAAAELRDKREWLTLALEGGKLGLWRWDVATNTTRYSDELVTMLGYTVAELGPDMSTWESLIHLEDLPGVQGALREYLSGRIPQYEAELRVSCRSGEWRWIMTRGRVVERHANGAPWLLAGTHLDITERKVAELELRESRRNLRVLNEQLEVRVAEEVHKNREKDTRLLQQEKLASIGQLAAGVAHEINNPMGFITSNLSMLKRYSVAMKQYFAVVDEVVVSGLSGREQELLLASRKKLDLDFIMDDLQTLLAESTDGAERIKRIVLDLKDFARPDEQAMRDADLNQLVQSTLNIVRSEIRSVAELEMQLAEKAPLFCYPQQINQVISNLLVNAAHAIDQQGIITICTRYLDPFVVLTVTDTGKGIPPELRTRIFEPFFTTKDVGKGTGLGLSISYDIVKKHGGEISVESEVGVGTTFTVRLPINAAGIPAAPVEG